MPNVEYMKDFKTYQVPVILIIKSKIVWICMVTIKKKVACGFKISKVTNDSKRKYFAPKNIHFKL